MYIVVSRIKSSTYQTAVHFSYANRLGRFGDSRFYLYDYWRHIDDFE